MKELWKYQNMKPKGNKRILSRVMNWSGIVWFARSPDLTLLYFYLWGTIKAIVYRTRIDTKNDSWCIRWSEAAEINSKFGKCQTQSPKDIKCVFETVNNVLKRKHKDLTRIDWFSYFLYNFFVKRLHTYVYRTCFSFFYSQNKLEKFDRLKLRHACIS